VVMRSYVSIFVCNLIELYFHCHAIPEFIIYFSEEQLEKKEKSKDNVVDSTVFN
jgi:hypothetical protein